LLGRMRLAALVGGVLTALAIPAAAHASTTKTVYMGEPPKTQDSFEQKYSTDVNDFFPHGITIHAGDKIKFIPGFHTVDLPPRGGQKTLPFVMASGPLASGVNDQAGQPFWFNGKVNELNLNPALLKATTKATYDGKSRVDSGVNAGPGPGKPFVVTFPKKGTFTYYCDVHPGMKGVVHVVAPTAKAPTVKDDAKTINKQVAADLASAKQLAKTTAPAGTVQVGGGGRGGVEYYGFFGPTAAISVGTTLTFQMGKGALETHTATTDKDASAAPPPAPGGNDQIPSVYLAGLSNTFQGSGPFNPIATYGSDPAGGTPASLTPSSHGNGFWNSGAMDNNSASPLPSNNSVRFDAAGTYTFYCLIHSFMHITIKVQ
jgi:plastocyanin